MSTSIFAGGRSCSLVSTPILRPSSGPSLRSACMPGSVDAETHLRHLRYDTGIAHPSGGGGVAAFVDRGGSRLSSVLAVRSVVVAIVVVLLLRASVAASPVLEFSHGKTRLVQDAGTPPV